MQRRPHPLALTTLSLAGLCACDVERAPGEAPVARQAVVWQTPLEGCLVDPKLVFHHGDGTTDVTSSPSQGFAELARPGDVVEVAFGLTQECAAKHGTRVTLASYTSPGITYGLKPKTPPQAHDVHTARVGEGGGHLKVRLPDCFFELDLAFGEPAALPNDPADGYEAQNRLIAQSQGGSSSCEDVPRLAIEQFDTVGAGWGDAPVKERFGWKIAAEEKLPLTCELDLDADGTPEQVLSPCPTDTSQIKIAGLPLHEYAQVGRHRPEFVVSDGSRRVWAATTVYANHLDYKPHVRFVEQLPGFVAAEVAAAAPPAESTVALHYTSEATRPTIKPDEVIVGKSGASGYMLRVTKVSTNGAALVVAGVPVGFDEVLAGGTFGVRDLAIDTRGARCTDDKCLGVLTPVAEAPSHTPVKQLALAEPSLLDDPQEAAFGVKIAVPLGEMAEIEVFGGVVVKEFMIDWGVLSVDVMDLRMIPTAKVTASFKGEVMKESFELGNYYLGTLPTPIPLSILLNPRFDLDVGVKFSTQVTLSADATLRKHDDQWTHGCEPKVEASVTSIAQEWVGEAKVTHVPELELSLGLLTGPYVGPMASVGLKGTADTCKACLTSFVEAGGELGWNAPWGAGNLFEPIKVVLAEIELWKKCVHFGLPACTPEPPEQPPGGGSWGDVHLVSYDGLAFEFQAGGEFVLTRATAGAPFEVQTRQEPSGNDLRLSYNTAVATVIAGHRVGVYTRLPAELYIDGQATQLQPGESFGDGLVTRVDDGYELNWPSGETLKVKRVAPQNPERHHLNLSLKLTDARAGAVEGLLGDADGDHGDDIGLGGPVFVPQPASSADLYGPNGFAAAWRVADGQSLFDYAPGTSAATFRDAPYSEMPTDAPPTRPHVDLADQLCQSCPATLREACMLDVAHTGDPALAEGCHEQPAEPSTVMFPAGGPVILSPDSGGTLDCTDPKLVFRVPGAPDVDQYPNTHSLTIRIEEFDAPPAPIPSNWLLVEEFKNQTAPGGGAADWGTRFQCEPLGDGAWSLCTYRPVNVAGVCNPDYFTTQRRWTVRANWLPTEIRSDRANFEISTDP